MVKTYKKGTVTQLSNNFKSTEFDCHGKNCCGSTKIDEQLVVYLQKIREHFGKSITISSGYRCEKHNKSVNGATSSRHAKGMAADIIISGVAPAEVAKYAESIGVKGIGLYEKKHCGDDFVHIDTRTNKAFWYGHVQEPRTTFGGSPAIEASKPNTNNPVQAWQEAALKDGFSFPSGADGIWGKECEKISRVALCQNRGPGKYYKYQNLTKFIQTKLGLKADGLFGQSTEIAVTLFQTAAKLPATGIVDSATWKKLLGVK
jgi:hypothetical protein